MLEGYKTYLVAAVAIISAIIGYFDGQLTLLQVLQATGIAIGISGNRAVIWAGQVLNAPYPASASVDPRARQLVTYLGVALAIITAIIAGLNGEQEPAVTIAAILGALGINFLGLGAKKQAEGTPPVAVTTAARR